MAQDRVRSASGERIERHGRVRLECRNRIPPERLGVVTRRLREAETRARAAEAVVARMRLLWLARGPMSNDDRGGEDEGGVDLGMLGQGSGGFVERVDSPEAGLGGDLDRARPPTTGPESQNRRPPG